MPRWLSEGISVYEERQADKTWGQTINPKYREMLLGDGLVPISKLSGAFLSPPSPLHLQFAYFESSLAVQYLVEKHGIETLKRVLVDLVRGMPINDSLARYAGSLETLDADFAEYARRRAKRVRARCRLERAGAAPAGDEHANRGLAGRRTRKTTLALGRLARQLINEGKSVDAKEPVNEMRSLYPDDDTASGPHALLAEICHEQKDTSAERAALDRLAELSDDDVDTFSRLVELATTAEDWACGKKALATRGSLSIHCSRAAPCAASAGRSTARRSTSDRQLSALIAAGAVRSGRNSFAARHGPGNARAT